MTKKVFEYRVMFDNGEEAIVFTKSKALAFIKAKRILAKRFANNSNQKKLDSMASQGFKNVRIEIL